MRRVATYLIMLCAVNFATAQIRIIPREKVLSAAEPKMAVSPLQFVPQSVDFGAIDEMMGVWQGRAKLVNRGADTVVVAQLKSTCGCLKAELSKRIILPKEEVEVRLKYYPRGHAGSVMQRVFLYTTVTGEDPVAVLRLTGKVIASADRSDDYPYSRGVLLLRQDRVVLKRGEQLRVACMNGGSTPIRPKVDTLLTSRGVKVRFEPSRLEPKQEGYMMVELSAQTIVNDTQSAKIYLMDIGVPPRQGGVEVLVGGNEK